MQIHEWPSLALTMDGIINFSLKIDCTLAIKFKSLLCNQRLLFSTKQTLVGILNHILLIQNEIAIILFIGQS